MAKGVKPRQDTFTQTINKLIFSLNQERKQEKKNEAKYRFPWERYLSIFIFVTLPFVTFAPKEYYLRYFVFILLCY